VVLLIPLFVAIACGGSQSSGGTAPYKVGFIDANATGVASHREVVAAMNAVKKDGSQTIVQDAAQDASKANTICTGYIAQKVNAVIVDVFSGAQMTQCLTAASSANIPVFGLASALAPGMAGNIDTAIAGPINQKMVDYVKTLANPRILSLQFSPGPPCLARQQEEFKELQAAGISLNNVQSHEVKIPGQVEDSQATTAAWLAAHPKSANQDLVIWGCFSDTALGALAALNQSGRSAPIYTWDLTSQLVPLLKNGTVKATSISDADKMGQQLAAMIKAYRGGNTTAQNVEADALVLDASNIDAYVASNPVS